MDDELLFATYKETVYRVCRYLLPSVSDAEDVCQEVFVKALLADRSQVMQMKSWLIRIAVNESHTLLRRRAKGRDKERLFWLLQRAHAPQFNPVEEALVRQETSNQFCRWLERLPKKIRVVLVLRYSGELTTKETADVLGIPEGTVKSRMNRGLRMLRKSSLAAGAGKEGDWLWEQPASMK